MTAEVSSRALRNLFGIAVAILSVATLAAGLTVWGMRADAIAGAERDTGNLATIFAEQMNHFVKAFDATLVDMQTRLAATEASAPDKYESAIRSEDVHRFLLALAKKLPHADVIAVIDAQGRVVNQSKDWPAPTIDVSDREFFQVQKSGAASGVYVSTPVVSRGTGEWTIFFSRRLESAQKKFLGLVQVGIRLNFFREVYGSIGSLTDQTFLFLRRDGTILVRYPDDRNRAGEKMPPQSAWYARVAEGGGFYRTPGYFDGSPRFVAVREVADYPLVVNVAVTEDAALALWHRRATMIAAGTILTLICAALLLRAFVIQFRKLSEQQASLAEREGRLSEKSRDLERANLQVDAALNNMSQGLCMFDNAGQLVIWNERYLRVYGMSPNVIRPGISLVDVLEHRRRAGNFCDDPERFAEELCTRLATGETIQTVSSLGDGRIIAVDNKPMIGGGWVATHEDITERRQSEERIARMARHDTLTELANRVLFRERMDDALKLYEITGRPYSVFIFDLDMFKSVNDSLGHFVGDALLKAVAKRLQSVAHESATVGRLGGDEFAILQLAEGNQRANAVALAKKVLKVVSAPYEIEGHRLTIGISIGIAMAPHDGLDAQQLLKNADLALYRGKSEGRNTYRFFESHMDDEVRLHRALEIDLHNAIANHELEAYYQPLVNVESREICGLEALIRWHHPQHGMIPPDRFIRLAEERGMIHELGRFMLRQACRDAAGMPPHIRVAVNLSPVQFRSGDLLQLVTAALEESGLPPERLELEITESVLLQKDTGNFAMLHQIKKLGVSIVLDDFGTGYSSLSYLRLFPVDKIKIDQSFIREMPTRADCAAIVCAITSLSRELNIVTTAEGVETEEQLKLVRAAGCKLAQGYLFGRPMPASKLELSSQPPIAPRQVGGR